MDRKNANLTFSHVNTDVNWDASTKKKIIRMSSAEFCIGIISHSKGLEQIYQYSFVSNLSLNDKIATIVDIDNERNIRCENSLFRLYTNYNVQVPEEFHDENSKEAILSVITDCQKQYIPFEEKVDFWELYNISAWEKELYAEVKDKFPDYKLSTVVTSLLNIVARQQKEKDVLIFVENNNFTIIAVEKQKLIGINTFPFQTEKDFLYYSYAFLRKRFADLDNIQLKLCGNVTKQSSLYKLMSKYCQHVEILSQGEESTDNNYSFYCDLFE
jgi:predicted DNA-binding protein YlxM (UPF0122 family)